MRNRYILLLLVTIAAVASSARAGENKACERRLRGHTYECLAVTNDPAGICYVNCMTRRDADDGFVLVERKSFANRTTEIECTCGGAGLPGPRWFSCTDDGGEFGVAVEMSGKVAPNGRRIRAGFTEYAGGAWADEFTCRRVDSCTPTWGPCSSLTAR